MKLSGIYAIRNTVNGKMYIGSSVDIRARWAMHRSDLKHQTHHSIALQRAWAKYGRPAFVFEVLELIEDADARLARETELIASHKAADGLHGYNCCPEAGTARGVKHTEEAKRRMSEAQKKIPYEVRLTYCKSFAGRTHTDETKAKMSANSKRVSPTAEQRAIISNTHKGKTISPEHRAIVGKVTAERNKTPEMRAKVSAALKGRVFTPEWKEKLRQAAKRRRLGNHPDIATMPLDFSEIPVVNN